MISKTTDIKNGDLVVVRLEDEVTLKYFKQTKQVFIKNIQRTTESAATAMQKNVQKMRKVAPVFSATL